MEKLGSWPYKWINIEISKTHYEMVKCKSIAEEIGDKKSRCINWAVGNQVEPHYQIVSSLIGSCNLKPSEALSIIDNNCTLLNNVGRLEIPKIPEKQIIAIEVKDVDKNLAEDHILCQEYCDDGRRWISSGIENESVCVKSLLDRSLGYLKYDDRLGKLISKCNLQPSHAINLLNKCKKVNLVILLKSNFQNF